MLIFISTCKTFFYWVRNTLQNTSGFQKHDLLPITTWQVNTPISLLLSFCYGQIPYLFHFLSFEKQRLHQNHVYLSVQTTMLYNIIIYCKITNCNKSFWLLWLEIRTKVKGYLNSWNNCLDYYPVNPRLPFLFYLYLYFSGSPGPP